MRALSVKVTSDERGQEHVSMTDDAYAQFMVKVSPSSRLPNPSSYSAWCSTSHTRSRGYLTLTLTLGVQCARLQHRLFLAVSRLQLHRHTKKGEVMGQVRPKVR